MENPPLFYLSYARANDSHLVRRFFDDLSTTIADYLNLSRDLAGFYEEAEYQQTSEWSDAAAEALQNSLTMVCLLSPAYLRSDRAGKEWQVFKKRRRLDPARPELPHVIVPVSWISCPGPVPGIVREVLAHPDHIYQRRSMMEMFRSSTMFRGEYADFVKALANQIIETTVSKKLRALDAKPTMSTIDSAFQLWDGPEPVFEEPRNRSSHDKTVHSEVEFVKAKPVNEQRSVSHVASGNQPLSDSRVETETKKYSVFAVTNDPQVLDIIEPCCRLSADIELQTYADLKQAMDRTNERIRNGQGLPELFVMDLDLDVPLKNIKELNKSASKILGLSSNADHELKRKITILPKPLGSYTQVIDQIKYLANLARASAAVSRDQSRPRRVFLSFSSKDEDKATELRESLLAKGIEPSYSPTDMQTGKNWRDELEAWLAKADVFLALISDAYLQSHMCRSELISFWRRLEDPKSDKLVPVYYESPDRNNQFLREFVEERQHFHVSASDLLDKSSLLAEHINSLLRR